MGVGVGDCKRVGAGKCRRATFLAARINSPVDTLLRLTLSRKTRGNEESRFVSRFFLRPAASDRDAMCGSAMVKGSRGPRWYVYWADGNSLSKVTAALFFLLRTRGGSNESSPPAADHKTVLFSFADGCKQRVKFDAASKVCVFLH